MALKKVLVVDDAELVHKMHALVLARYHGSELLHAYNGTQALEMLHKHPDVQLILLDINMPVMDGLRFLEARNQLGIFKNIPVIIISTEGKEDDTKRGMAAGAVAYVTKPFRPGQLHAIIDGLLGEKAGDPT